MNPREIDRLDRELGSYLDELLEDMGRKERRRAMAWYVTGLLLDGDRKSIEPIAGRLVDDPREIEAMRQRLQQCVSVSKWAEEDVWRRLALKVDRELPEVEALVIDDTGFAKKGDHSVAVARQYSGTLGRVDNCQVAVSLHLASERGSACIGMRLYLPETWASDAKRRGKVGVPAEVQFEPKWKISLAQLDDAKRWGVQNRVVLADGGYGEVTAFREGLTERGLEYVVAVPGSIVVWGPGTGPIPPDGTREPGARGPLRKMHKTGAEKPATLLDLARSLGASACRVLTWREGSRGRQRSRFGAIRVRTAHKHLLGVPPGHEQWLMYEWPMEEPEPTKFWLSTVSAKTPAKRLVHLAKLRWRVERDYQELKQEVGLDHFEGRSWTGFHHHAALCAVAHGFLALRRALFPPEDRAVDSA
jgi:SRSO17 transposase